MAFSLILFLRVRPRSWRREYSDRHFAASGGAGRLVDWGGFVEDPGVLVDFAGMGRAGVSGRFVSVPDWVEKVLVAFVRS